MNLRGYWGFWVLACRMLMIPDCRLKLLGQVEHQRWCWNLQKGISWKFDWNWTSFGKESDRRYLEDIEGSWLETWRMGSSLYKFDSWLSGCPFSYVFFIGSWLGQITSDPHQTFSICIVWSPELFKIVWASPRACVHAQRVKLCMLFLPTFFCQFFDILKHFLTENEKNLGHISGRYQLGTFFILFPFFLFSQEDLQNGRNV